MTRPCPSRQYPAIPMARTKPQPQQTQAPQNPLEPDSSSRAKLNARKRLSLNKRRAKLTPAERLEVSWRRYARPPTPRSGSQNEKDLKKVTLANAHMAWSDLDKVYRTYLAAAVMSNLLGEMYVVDHTVPLSHPLVCGLHSHTNLVVISSRENNLKGNSYWPDMPEITWATLDFLLDNSIGNAQYLANSRPKSAQKRRK